MGMKETAKAVRGQKIKGKPGLHLDPIKHRWVRTHRPQPHMKPAHSMQPGHFAHSWGGDADKGTLQDQHQGMDAAALHKAEVENAVGNGHSVPPPILRKHGVKGLNHRPLKDEGARIGNKDWWKSFGWRANPGWDGKWRHLEGEAADPERYNQKGVERASEHMLRLREMRQKGNVPDGLLEVVSLFAITSKRTVASTHERIFPAVTDWLAQPKDQQHLEDLTKAMRPLGVQNGRTSEFEKSREIFDTLREGMLKFPDHGPSLRDWMASQPHMKGLGNAKMSFMLEVMGYEDVACIDARVIQAMTGTRGDAASRLASRIAKSPQLYREFENALARGASFKSDDPKELRLGMAQWRLWDAHGGSDTDHGVLWQGIARVTGLQSFAMAAKAFSGHGTVTQEHGAVLAAGLSASYEVGAGPVVYDAVPVMGEAVDKMGGWRHQTEDDD